MEGFWSLTFFTIFGQAAVGMAILKAVFGDTSKEKLPCWLLVAVVLLGGATVMSIFHLSAPFSAPYAITNASSSWLSREILAVGLFGAVLCGYYFIRTAWMLYVAAAAGVLLVYTMASVYTLPTVMVWNTCLTFASFLAIAFLLGATMLFTLDRRAAGDNEAELKALLRGWQPLVIGVALSVQLVLAAWQFGSPQMNVDSILFIGQYALLLAGAVLAFMAIMRSFATAEATPCPCVAKAFGFASTLIWVGALAGRMLFYTSYTYFGM